MNLLVNIKYSGTEKPIQHYIWYDEYTDNEQFPEIFKKFNDKISKGGLVLFENNEKYKLIINVDKIDYMTVG